MEPVTIRELQQRLSEDPGALLSTLRYTADEFREADAISVTECGGGQIHTRVYLRAQIDDYLDEYAQRFLVQEF